MGNNQLKFQSCPGWMFKVLPHGLNTVTLDDFIAFYNFSQQRRLIIEKYLKFKAEIDNIFPNATHWIDGSFVESKPDPSDIDTVIFFSDEELNSLSPNDHNKLMSLIGRGNQSKKIYMTDAYGVPLAKPGHSLYNFSVGKISYWLKWFGSTRNLDPKGIVRLIDPAITDTMSVFQSNSWVVI